MVALLPCHDGQTLPSPLTDSIFFACLPRSVAFASSRLDVFGLGRSRMTVSATRAAALVLALLAVFGAAGHAEAAVRVEVEGIRGATLRENIERSISLSAYRNRTISPAQVRRLHERAPEEIRLAMQPYGYYRPDIESELIAEGDDWIARFHIRVRISVKVRELDIDVGQDEPGLSPEEKALRTGLAKDIRDGFPLQPEDRLIHERYERGKTMAQAAIEGRGYLAARQSSARVEVHVSDDAADIELRWNPGLRYRLGETRFEGAQFPDEFMQRFVQLQAGQPYDSDALLRLQRRLIDADYFGFVSVAPDLDNADGDLVPILVNVVPAPRNVFLAGVSIGTDSGVGVRGGVQRRWLNQRGHKAHVDVELSQRLSAAAAQYTIPLPGSNLRSLAFGASHRREETVTSESDTSSLFALESRLWLGWTRELGLRAVYGDFTIAEQRNRSTLVFAEARLNRRRANDDLFPTEGYSLGLEARAGSDALLSDTDLVQVRAEARWIQPLGERQRLHLRGIVGSTWVDDFDALPPPLRFFAGGDRSIRGYRYHALGPRDDNDFVIGGRHIAVIGAEFERDISASWAIAGFVDSGNAFNRWDDFRLRTGVGAGVRWRSPVGLVRVDIGRGLNDPQNVVELHLVIGPPL